MGELIKIKVGRRHYIYREKPKPICEKIITVGESFVLDDDLKATHEIGEVVVVVRDLPLKPGESVLRQRKRMTYYYAKDIGGMPPELL